MSQHFQLSPGEHLYKYQLINRIGGGGFGDVWLAHDRSISRDIAVKVLDASRVSVDERLSEARIGNLLDHQNLVKMHYADVVGHNGTNLVIIAMDYHANGSIVRRINAGNFMPIPEAIRYIVDILRGLEYLHEQNIYHCDIKPQNILLGPSGEGILTDYGISCYSPNLQPIRPKNAYKLHISPEILNNNQICIQTDIYQVGITMFRLLNGLGTISEKFNRLGELDYNQLVQQGKVVQSDDYQAFIPRNLKAVVNKAIHVDPQRRYQSALEMRRALEKLGYPGYWTCNAQGNFEGYKDGYEYRFEEEPCGGGLYDFTAFKKKESTLRETCVKGYSYRKITRKQADNLKQKFMQHVVMGG